MNTIVGVMYIVYTVRCMGRSSSVVKMLDYWSEGREFTSQLWQASTAGPFVWKFYEKENVTIM